MPTPFAAKAGPMAILLVALAVLMARETQAQPSALDAEQRAEVVEGLAEAMLAYYVFPEAGEACALRLRADLAAGRFDDHASPDGLAAQLTWTLQDVTDDKHLRARAGSGRPDRSMETEDSEQLEQAQAFAVRASAQKNHGFEQVFRLPGNVGLLDLRGFHSPAYAAPTAHAAMGFLATSDALIVDLRQNGGGDPEMVQLLCSYLFDEPTHLNSLFWREGDVTQEFWTLEQLPGPRLGDVPVFVLTSGQTFSGAEEYAYNLQTRGRATIVGETTGGGAHPGGEYDLPHGLRVFISVGRAINPVTGTNWEGTGVVPDLACPVDEALDRALDLAQAAAQRRQDERARADRS